MIKRIMVVKDLAAQVYGTPFAVSAIGMGVRGFTDEVNRQDQNNAMYNHPEDFELYHLADYDDNTGEITATQPKLINRAVEVKR